MTLSSIIEARVAKTILFPSASQLNDRLDIYISRFSSNELVTLLESVLLIFLDVLSAVTFSYIMPEFSIINKILNDNLTHEKLKIKVESIVYKILFKNITILLFLNNFHFIINRTNRSSKIRYDST